ncbi:uncharacterized protein LOC131874386 [Cryptomeria japonica]|uniref:uncharacterized protein LOC131874386 n=1 Tax=Cryptomeria japonica TaxID=3369 RepID=UPI0027DA72DA|nr:uncharacterized protein LOC131874386 [Cryptomeria japonica]
MSWLQKGHQILVNDQAYVEFHIGSHRDNVLCDVMPIDVHHVLLGRPGQFGRKAVHDGRENTYTIENDGDKNTLMPIKEKEEGSRSSSNSKVMMVSGEDFLHDLKNEEFFYALVLKPKSVLSSSKVDDFRIEVQDILNEHNDIIASNFPSELPPMRSISHHIDLILRASLPNKAYYRLTPMENEEIRKQV